jgi:hypothetical protein
MKKMKKSMYFVFCALYVQGIIAQQTNFSKIFDIVGNGNNNGIGVKPIGDNFVVLSLTHFNNTQTCTNLSYFDSTGVLLNSRLFKNLIIENLTFDAVDSTFLCYGNYFTTNDKFFAFVMKNKFNGDTIWSTNFESYDIELLKGVTTDLDGNIYAIGANYYSPSDSIHVMKLSSDGILQWYKKLSNGFPWCSARSVQVISDSTLIVSSAGNSFLTADPDDPLRSGTSLFVLTNNGALVRDTAYLFSKKYLTDSKSYFLNTLNNQHCLLGLMDTTFQTNGLYTDGNTCIYGINDDLNTTWKTLFPFHFHPSIVEMANSSNNEVIGCGKTGYQVNGSLVGYPWLFKIAATGSIVWERFITNEAGAEGLNAITEMPDHSIIGVGLVQKNNKNYTWIIKLNNFGCSTPTCDSLSIFTSVIFEPQSIDVSIVPNPTSGKVKILGNHEILDNLYFYRLCDESGKATGLIQINKDDYLDLDAFRLSSGVTDILFYNKNKSYLGNKKIVYFKILH